MVYILTLYARSNWDFYETYKLCENAYEGTSHLSYPSLFPSIGHCLIKQVCTYLFLFVLSLSLRTLFCSPLHPNIENSYWQSIPVDAQPVSVD